MGLLEKYGRKKTGEKRNKPIGAKIEQSLYDAFNDLCDRLGLTVSDGIRYLIMEEITKEKTEREQANITKKTTVDNEHIKVTPHILHTDKEGNKKVNQNPNKPKTRTGKMSVWTVNDKLPCPLCEKFFLAKNYPRHCRRVHNITSGYELIQSHLEKVNQMVVKEKSEQ